MSFFDTPHRRFNLLTNEWIQVSPHRTQRPWQGKQEDAGVTPSLDYDPTCYLCPSNERAGGKEKNPAYSSTFVFENDFSALLPDVVSEEMNEDNLLVGKTERGLCRVLCFSPKHNVTLPEMSQQEVRVVVDTWVQQFEELSQIPWINYVQIFENKGSIMGCSNPHPHGQIWAQETIPVEPAKELHQQLNYFKAHGRTLLSDYLKIEMEKEVRIVTENEHFVVLVPFWAFWPFETMVISKRSFSNFLELHEDEKEGLADIIRRITIRYDNLFETSFPYSAGFHPAPTDGLDHKEWHFHMHFYPPLLRSATVKKFSVGYEMLGNQQRDITAELAASMLRDLSEIHYSRK